MKAAIKLLLLTPMIFTLAGCNKEDPKPSSNDSSSEEISSSTSSVITDPTPVDVVIISGQSNAVGCTHSNCISRSIGHSKYQEYLKGYPDIKIAFDCWTKDDGPRFYSQNSSEDQGFMKVMLGQGNGLGTFGPEIGIGERMHEKYANKLVLIKFACGASNLKDDWLAKDSPMYPRLIKYVKQQMAVLETMGYIPTIKAFCWMQGEGDSYDGYYQEYYENTKQFVGNLREDLLELSGNKEFAFIDAGISNASVWQYYRKVNEAKQQFAEESENNIYIDTIGAGMHTNEEPFGEPDVCHYDTESEVLLGNLFAEAFEPFLEPIEE